MLRKKTYSSDKQNQDQSSEIVWLKKISAKLKSIQVRDKTICKNKTHTTYLSFLATLSV